MLYIKPASYILCMIEFYNEDCFERFNKLKENSVDAIITDPPYFIGFKGQTSKTEWDTGTDQEYYELLLRFFQECHRVLKAGGTLWMCFARTKIKTVLNALDNYDKSDDPNKLQCNLENWLTYARQKGRGASTKLKSQAEEIFHITKGKNYQWNTVEYLREVVVPYITKDPETGEPKPRGWFLDQNDGKRKRWVGTGNVLCFTSPFFKNRFEKQIHSTQKPFLLFTELIMLSTKPGELVFDPFAGSGSSGVAADCCGRNWIGCELDKEMYDKANEWVHNYDKELAEEYYKSRVRQAEGKPKKFSLNKKPKKFSLNKRT